MWKCQAVEMQVMILEMAYHIPPPFRFSAHWDVKRSHSWDAEYDVDRYNPSSGCSLSYALHKFKPFGYHLLRMTENDAVFVHESVRSIIELGGQTVLLVFIHRCRLGPNQTNERK